MVALIQCVNHAANKGETAGRYQFDTYPTGIGLNQLMVPLGLILTTFSFQKNPERSRDTFCL